jgi:G3E family GTPase
MAKQSSPPIAVTLLTGFLGAGKTTLLNRLLANTAKVAVIVNEIGPVGVDQQLLNAGGGVNLLAGGCLCCTLQGTLAPTLKNLWLGRQDGSLPAFERVIIETTGLADPAPMLAALLADRWLARRFHLQLVVTVVDAVLGDEQLKRIPLTVRQVCAAQRLLISKTDSAEPSRLAALQQVLARLAPGAEQQLLQGSLDDGHWLTAAPISSTAPATASQPLLWLPASHHQLATFTLQPPAIPPHSQALQQWLQSLLAQLGETVLRLKGVVAVADDSAPVLVQAVQQWLLECAPCPDAVAGPLVLIADGLEVDSLLPLLNAGGWQLLDHQPLAIRQ